MLIYARYATVGERIHQRRHSITEDDPDAIGSDGRVRLRCHLPQQDSVWFSAICGGATGCGHLAPISVLAAILRMGSGEATMRQLAGRLRCSGCSGQQVSVTLQSDVRPTWIVQRDGPRAASHKSPLADRAGCGLDGDGAMGAGWDDAGHRRSHHAA